jgi:NitT/TauT family transport system substrate-binding protein
MVFGISRRDFLKLTAGAAAGAALAPRIAVAQPTVRIGTAVLADYGLAGPVIIAAEKGFFKEQGVNAEFLPFRGGPDLLKAVMVGEVLIGVTGSTDIIQFREAGSPIKMVATHGEGNNFVIVTAPDGPTMSELKGKAIGVTRPGSASWILVRMAAKAQGWDPDRDVKILGLGGLDAQLAALARKEIAAFIWGDYGGVSVAQGRTKVIFKVETLTPKWISFIQYSSEDQIKKNSQQVRGSVRALFQAFRFMKANPEESARIAAAKLGWSPEVVLTVHKSWVPIIPADGHIEVEALRAMQETLLESGTIKKRLPLDEHYTTEFTPVRL